MAIIEENEATIKTYQKKGKKIFLKPANKRYQIKEYNPEKIKIQGKVVGILKKIA